MAQRWAHSGMLASAKWLLQGEGDTLQRVLDENSGFRLVLAGHSLGADTASLFGLMLRESSSTLDSKLSEVLNIPVDMITCWGFGCPPCVNLELATATPFINNVVLQDDVFSRISLGALEDLRSEIAQTEWSQAFKDGTTQRQFVDMVEETAQRVSALPVTSKAVAVFNVAKREGLSKLVSAGNAVVSQVTKSKSSKAGAWLSIGAVAAGTLLKAAHDRVSHGVHRNYREIEERARQSDQQAAAAALATHAAASTSETRDEVALQRRLFVPGTLFHILRQLLPGGESGPRKFTHVVMRGTDPKARFTRIVLSNSMLSDHSAPAYVDAVVDSLNCLSRDSNGEP